MFRRHVVNNVGMFQLSDRNDTSTRYKAIIQFWRLSIANQGKTVRATLIANMCKPSFILADEASNVIF